MFQCHAIRYNNNLVMMSLFLFMSDNKKLSEWLLSSVHYHKHDTGMFVT